MIKFIKMNNYKIKLHNQKKMYKICNIKINYKKIIMKS